MSTSLRVISALLVMIVFSIMPASGDRVTTTWGGDAKMIYDTGFMHMLMKNNKDGGVSLFNMDLVENDSPGSGISEKGVSSDAVWGKNRARKILSQ